MSVVQKLMAYGYVRGTMVDQNKPEKKLMETIIETVANCFDDSRKDDAVQLQILKAFLTAVRYV